MLLVIGARAFIIPSLSSIIVRFGNNRNVKFDRSHFLDLAQKLIYNINLDFL